MLYDWSYILTRGSGLLEVMVSSLEEVCEEPLGGEGGIGGDDLLLEELTDLVRQLWPLASTLREG